MRNPFKPPRRTKRVTPIVRGYQLSLPGAGSGALNWSTDRPPHEDVRQALATMRAKSRAEIQNGDYLAGFLLSAQRNVIGPGLTLRPLHQHADVAEQTTAQWRAWAEDATPSGESWWRTEMLALSSLIVDGEIVAELMDTAGGLRVRLIDAARLDHQLDGRTPNGASVRMGIEVDAAGKPVAYWFRGWGGSDNYVGSRRVRVPARQIVYVGNTSLVGQTRGMPFTTSALLRLEQLRHYEASELIAARLGNKKMGYLQTEAGAESPYALDDQESGKDDKEDAESPIDVNRRLWAEMMMGGGGVDYGVEVTPLDPGQSFVGLDWPHPAAAFPDFVGGQLKGAAAGLGISYHGLSGDLSRVNYSAGRLGEISSRQTWLHLRRLLTDGFHTPVFRRWCELASMRDQLPGLPSELCRAEWVGRGFEHIQPREQARANELDVALRIKSRREIIRESGRDPDDVFQQIADELAELKRLGIDL